MTDRRAGIYCVSIGDELILTAVDTRESVREREDCIHPLLEESRSENKRIKTSKWGFQSRGGGRRVVTFPPFFPDLN